MERTAERPSLLLRQQSERGQRFDIESARRHEAITRLVIAQGEIHSRTVSPVDLIPVIAPAHENCLGTDDHVALHLRWRSFKGGPIKNAASLKARVAWRGLKIGRLLSFFIFFKLVVLQLLRRRAGRCPVAWGSRRLFPSLFRLWNRSIGRTGWSSSGWLRSQTQRTLRFRVDLARDLQPVADLVTPDGSRRVGVLFPGDFAVVKSLVLQLLLDRFNDLVGPRRRAQNGQEKQSRYD